MQCLFIREVEKGTESFLAFPGTPVMSLILFVCDTSIGWVTISHFVEEKFKSWNGCECPKVMPLNWKFSPNLSDDQAQVALPKPGGVQPQACLSGERLRLLLLCVITCHPKIQLPNFHQYLMVSAMCLTCRARSGAAAVLELCSHRDAL